jgi:hypothetical protein
VIITPISLQKIRLGFILLNCKTYCMISKAIDSINNMKLMLPLFLIIMALVISYVPELAFAQSGYHVIKTTHTERFIMPYTTANGDRTHPFVYTFAKPISESWILNIQNNLSYAYRPDAKVVVKLQEPSPSDKFIEIGMYGETASNRFWAAVNTAEAGYIRIYDKTGVDGWSPTDLINIGYDSNQGLSINSGTKVLVDRLAVNGFKLGSIAVYGKDDPSSPLNAYSGNLSFEALWGKPSDSPIYYLPLGMLLGVGGVLVGLLVFKKRDKIEA